MMSNLEWLICQDPVHIGGADSDSRGNRNPIYRLPDGTPVIPGSSLRGALREDTRESNDYKNYENDWFGYVKESGENNDGAEAQMQAGAISLGWAFPLWFPVHILGYGNWWISCPAWLNRFWQLQGKTDNSFFTEEHVYSPNQQLLNKQSVYFRWLKLTDIKQYNKPELPLHGLQQTTIGFKLTEDKCLIVPDSKVNLFVEMGLVRQPRVSLKSREEAEASQEAEEDNKDGSLVKNLFSVEGLPPKAVFFFAWTMRNVRQTEEHWQKFLHSEHYLGGLWSIGYGRVKILEIKENNQNNQ